MHQKNLKINSLPFVFISSLIFLCTICNGQTIQKNSEVKIGKQTWMSKNLNVDKFQNGDLISEAKTAIEWETAGKNQKPAWCYYNNNKAFGAKYGKLYNWYAVSDPRGLAPKGWHIPTYQEYEELSTFLGGDNVSGTKMKNKDGWWLTKNYFITDTSRTNQSGFSGLPGGCRNYNLLGDKKFQIHFKELGSAGYWWTSSTQKDEAKMAVLVFTDPVLIELPTYMEEGCSVRCIKN